MQIALEHHRAGRLELAREIYRRVLAAEPLHADALHSLGVLEHQCGEHAIAAARLRQAIRVRPSDERYYHNLGEVLRSLRQEHGAIACYRQSIELWPDFAEAHNGLGLALQSLGKVDEAIATYQKAVRLKSDFAQAHNNLGTAWQQKGHLDQAAACYCRSIQMAPNYAEAHYNLGLVRRQEGRLDEACVCFRRATQCHPAMAEAWNDLGCVLGQQGNLGESLACFRCALEVKPRAAEFHHNLGVAHRDMGHAAEAVACFRRAVELKPDYAEALLDLASTLQNLGDVEAVAFYQRAVALRPDDAEALNSLGSALQTLGRLEAAHACLRLALERNPGYAEAYGNLGNVLKDQGKIPEAVASYRHAINLKPGLPLTHSCLLLGLQYLAHITPAELLAEHTKYDQVHATPLRSELRPHAKVRDPARTLRLGFVSPNFNRHPVGYFYVRPLEFLRQEEFHTILYSTAGREDVITSRFRAAAHTWRDLPGISDDALAKQIRDDDVDVLFDMASHAGGNRLLVLARKPATIQIAWAGPTGISAVDYLLTDQYLVPAGAESNYREKVLRLPDAYACYDPPSDAPPVGPSPVLTQGHVTFGSLNNLAKLTEEVLDLWGMILRRLPSARLLIRYHNATTDPGAQRRLRECFAAAGVDASRVDLLPSTPYAQRLDVYQQIDLALDTFPFSGCTTTCEALWMGVPVITCPGETYLSRQSFSILRNVGLDEFVAYDPTEYVDLAVATAADFPRLAARRACLREQMAASPLCDGRRFAAGLTRLLRDVWHTWCREP